MVALATNLGKSAEVRNLVFHGSNWVVTMCDDDDDIGIGNWANITHAITITSGYPKSERLKLIVAVGGLRSLFPTTVLRTFWKLSSFTSPISNLWTSRPLDTFTF
ncbi:hypothetical protein N7519_005182 [Penicillium mononematosum]|uniref:uncharacterized protein n=1 Tax=Penicillium mononematosum TaxID=268346 RepID=UPI002547E733|nr:uncharacterized protein N7519_005182 [Penicillium mononematosum]KAJ6183881.1 hypothetical protein N7519_005182 [Penicillium mononematosum]